MKRYYHTSELAKEFKVSIQSVIAWIELCEVKTTKSKFGSKGRLQIDKKGYLRLKKFNQLRETGNYTIQGCAAFSE